MQLIHGLIMLIVFVVVAGPALWSLATTYITGAIAAGLVVLTAPVMWIILYFCERQQKRIQLQIDKAIEDGADQGRLYALNMQYKEAEERQEKLTKFTCTTVALTVFTLISVRIALSI